MTKDYTAHRHASEPAEGGAGTPPPERGSPTLPDDGLDDAVDQDAEKDRSEGNPLAPPINTNPGS